MGFRSASVVLLLMLLLRAAVAQNFTVALYNNAGVPGPVITRTAYAAERAYLAAGIQSQWLVCPHEGCGSRLPADGRYLELFVMPQMQGFAEGGITGHPAGIALLDPELARPRGYAFYDAVNDISHRTLRPVELVLTSILLHESGHLLGLKHQAHGIMRANLAVSDMDDAIRGCAFTAQDEKKLRSALRPPSALMAVR